MLKILVIKPSSFGDIVHGLQVVQSLREQKSDCHISWVAGDIFAPIVSACSVVDEIFVYHRKGGVFKFYELLKELSKQNFDIVLDMQGLARSGLMTAASKAPRKIGRSDAREFAGLFYNEKVSVPENFKNAHAIEILLKFLSIFRASEELKGELKFRKSIEKFSKHDFIKKDFILIFPESRRPEKEWGKFGELTDVIIKNHSDLSVVWAGNNKNNDSNKPNAKNFIDLSGETEIIDLPKLISLARLVITNDSGPMHLAAAMNKSILALFGPTNAERFGPYPLYAPNNYYITAPNSNLSKLEVENVYELVREII